MEEEQLTKRADVLRVEAKQKTEMGRLRKERFGRNGKVERGQGIEGRGHGWWRQK